MARALIEIQEHARGLSYQRVNGSGPAGRRIEEVEGDRTDRRSLLVIGPRRPESALAKLSQRRRQFCRVNGNSQEV
jgi:hypothetical protein